MALIAVTLRFDSTVVAFLVDTKKYLIGKIDDLE